MQPPHRPEGPKAPCPYPYSSLAAPCGLSPSPPTTPRPWPWPGPRIVRLTPSPPYPMGCRRPTSTSTAPSQIRRRVDLSFAVVRATDGRVVGSTRFLELDYWQGPLVWPAVPGVPFGDPATAIPDAAEIGNTWLSPGAQGTGINTEAKLLMLRHAFETWGVRRISLRADARNGRSRAAMERLGFTCEGSAGPIRGASTAPCAVPPSTRSSTRSGRPYGRSSS